MHDHFQWLIKKEQGYSLASLHGQCEMKLLNKTHYTTHIFSTQNHVRPISLRKHFLLCFLALTVRVAISRLVYCNHLWNQSLLQNTFMVLTVNISWCLCYFTWPYPGSSTFGPGAAGSGEAGSWRVLGAGRPTDGSDWTEFHLRLQGDLLREDARWEGALGGGEGGVSGRMEATASKMSWIKSN